MNRFFAAVRRYSVWPCLLTLGAVLGGCASDIAPTGSEAKPVEQEISPTAVTGDKAALLIPLTGQYAADGSALLNASQMALFAMGDKKFTLLPIDTQGTAAGAAEAARQAVAGQAAIVLGPLRVDEVEAAAPITRAAGINMISFSTNTRVAGNGVFLMGFLINSQIDQMVGHAMAQGKSRFAIMAPNNEYGQAAVAAMQASVARTGSTLAQAEFYEPNTRDFSPVVKRLNRRDIDVIMLADGGLRLVNLASMLVYNNIDPEHGVMFLGTMFWNDPRLYGEASLAGGVFPAPSDAQFLEFAKRYSATYKTRPPRIASLAYDATSLSAVLFRDGAVSQQALLNPNGFSGIDGAFRFLPDGTSERVFAIKQLKEGKAQEIVPASGSFTRPSN